MSLQKIPQPAPVRPESWDESTDFRRYWWALWPLGLALWAAAAIVFLDKTGNTPFGTRVTQATDRFEQVVPAAEGQRFVVQNIHGSLRIETGPPGEGTIIVERKGSGDSGDTAREAIEGLRPQVSFEGDAVVLLVAEASGRELPVTAAVTLIVPPGARVEAETLFGDIDIETIGSADVAAGTFDGDIEVTIPDGAGLMARLDALHLRTQLDLVQVADAGDSAVFQSPGTGPDTVALDLRAPAGTVTLKQK